MSGESLGIVETRIVTVFDRDDPLRMRSGATLAPVEVAYETYGELNSDATNAVYICHALTGDAHAAGFHEGDTRPGWWDNMIGPGRPIDTDRWFVVASNILGGCRGTTGPSSLNPATGEPYALDFPLLDMADFVEVHRALARRLGIRSFAAVVGGSLGGMQVLQWALSHPAEMGRALIFAASSRLTAQNIAFSAVGRQAIMRDSGFSEGKFLTRGTSPSKGLSVARMMAHITYLSEEAFQEKFGRSAQGGELSPNFGIDFAVESYLEHQGQRFLSRFDPLSYLYLTRVMDYFDPFADPHVIDALAADPVRFLVVSFDTDWRFSTEHSRRIVRHLEGSRVPTSFREIHSPWGHDSFLLEIDDYHATVRAFLDRAAEELA
ncbi:homoserine O-acetyltransferase [Tessaracoccus bendigoensis DSM 12906]|uniref:Homoserine O-succinyltransferase n=1 Tax=Tessaracoccus bendigoensis DSM 12906 TaxID=1123357 RepID=A0A1M6GSL7_9ACTN|nr:homoserine O-acetyltransferase [Tessaracoccus bendigoensis]SHJ12907.1 homoserine O-acetyltransferase [Tessaracoccus bendigoensis DSM 12906]